MWKKNRVHCHAHSVIHMLSQNRSVGLKQQIWCIMLMDDLFYKLSSGAVQDTRYRQSNLKSSIDSFVKNKSLPF